MARCTGGTRFPDLVYTADEPNGYRQRKSLTPAFATVAIRNYVAAFYDSAYKVRRRLCQSWMSTKERRLISAVWEVGLDSGKRRQVPHRSTEMVCLVWPLL